MKLDRFFPKCNLKKKKITCCTRSDGYEPEASAFKWTSLPEICIVKIEEKLNRATSERFWRPVALSVSCCSVCCRNESVSFSVLCLVQFCFLTFGTWSSLVRKRLGRGERRRRAFLVVCVAMQRSSWLQIVQIGIAKMPDCCKLPEVQCSEAKTLDPCLAVLCCV